MSSYKRAKMALHCSPELKDLNALCAKLARPMPESDVSKI